MVGAGTGGTASPVSGTFYDANTVVNVHLGALVGVRSQSFRRRPAERGLGTEARLQGEKKDVRAEQVTQHQLRVECQSRLDLADRIELTQVHIEAQGDTYMEPFDPVIRDRRRLWRLFGFDYRIECYTPAEKRRYGYFTLPILRRHVPIASLRVSATPRAFPDPAPAHRRWRARDAVRTP